ncbi:aspartate/glutamate racemase family protein [Candidatus Bipolaricaulota bacterium]|nr:aspartate/glutamate racemase family protein [Candidatus Bipolaricaulota bacterium]
MKKVLIVNLNTTENMTEKMKEAAISVKDEDTEVEAITPEHGPVTIESSYDEAFAIPPVLKVIEEIDQEDADAILLGCFCDAGVPAAREIADIPVIAMEEATLSIALTLGNKFSIMTEKKPRVAMKELHIRRAGLMERLASIRPLGLSVADMDENPEKTKQEGIKLAEKMVEKDGAEVLIMGCAAMAGYKDEVEEAAGAPVLDPTATAFKVAELTADLGIQHSKVGLYHPPSPKEFK